MRRQEEIEGAALAGASCRAPAAVHGHGAPGARRRGGFSLLEMIVAMALMGLAVVGLLSLTRTALSNAAQVRDYERAAMLARTVMNDLLVADPAPLNYPLEGEWEDGWRWEAVLRPYEVPRMVAPGRFLLVQVRVAILWGPEEEPRRIELDGYRRMRIRPEQVDVLRGAGG